MKPVAKIAAHLAVGLTAFFLVHSVSKQESAIKPGSSARSQPGQAAMPEAARKSNVRPPKMRSAEFQAAWDAIPAKKWGKNERLEYQIRLLKEWAETDLEGALKAAFSETWNSGGSRVQGESFAFHRAFAEVFVDRSEEVWKLIQQRKAGVLESSILLEAWSATLLSKDKELYLTYLRDMDGSDFSKALSVAADGAQDKQLLTKILDVMSAKASSGLAVNGLDRSFFQAAVRVFSKDELKEKLLDSTGGMADFYSSLVAMNFAAASREASSEQVTAEIDSLPEDKRGPFAKALLTSYTGNADLLQTALDHLVDHEQWQLLDKGETSRAVQTMRQNADPVSLAEWAVSLPPREETTEMFHRGVEPYIRKSPEEAWNWIQEMADGYWRDRALAEYSQINLHVFNDPDKSAAAIGQIRDPAYRETVKGWRAGWEKQKGR